MSMLQSPTMVKVKTPFFYSKRKSCFFLDVLSNVVDSGVRLICSFLLKFRLHDGHKFPRDAVDIFLFLCVLQQDQTLVACAYFIVVY